MWMRSYRAIARACAAEDVIARSARVWVLDRKVLTYVGITLRRPEQTIGRSPAAERARERGRPARRAASRPPIAEPAPQCSAVPNLPEAPVPARRGIWSRLTGRDA
jgi:hypothetical protein